MKITTFDPLIVTDHANDIIKLFVKIIAEVGHKG